DFFADVSNNTINHNAGAGISVAGALVSPDFLEIFNTIVTSNRLGIGRDATGDRIDLNYCDVFGNNGSNYVNVSPAAGCISLEPRLDQNGFLERGSPCIDAGSGVFRANSTDILGQPRSVDDPHTPNTGQTNLDGTVVDIGAYEYQPPLEIISLQLAGSDSVITFSTT